MTIAELLKALNDIEDKQKDVSILIIDDEDINVDIDEIKLDKNTSEAYLCVNANAM
jgi:hypothetical protein